LGQELTEGSEGTMIADSQAEIAVAYIMRKHHL
jgi:hypothetical protein